MTRIAFIGLGNMGSPMVKNLVKNGHNVRAFDLSTSARDAVKKAGVFTCDSLDETVLNADVVISMLSSSEQVRELYLGNEQDGTIGSGILQQLNTGTLVIDCSTMAVAEAQSLAVQAQQLDIAFVDAPVSGSIGGARSATLTFIVGGSESAFTKAKPILFAMGNNVFHAGENGAGQAAKICNNMMLGILMSGSAEVLNLGQKNGVNPAVLTDIMIHSSGRNWALEVYNPYPNVAEGVPANKQYDKGFSSHNMYKDLTLALQVAKSSGVNVPMGVRATELYKNHAATYADKDFSSIIVQYDTSVLK